MADPAYAGLPVFPDDRARWDFPDIARSFGSGLASGAGQMLGLPGDIRQLIGAAHDQFIRPIEQRLGYQGPSPETMQQIYAQQPTLLPTSDQLAARLQSIIGPPHEPQTKPGDLAYTVGQKIPGIPLFLMTRGLR